MSNPVSGSERLFSLTICAYRKPGMEEEAYHQYLTEVHAPRLTDLLVQNKIVDYTMQHNTSESKRMTRQIFDKLPESSVADYDCFVHIVFRDVQDFISVTSDPLYKQVIIPDHENFADSERTKMITGWFGRHITEGKAVAAESGTTKEGRD